MQPTSDERDLTVLTVPDQVRLLSGQSFFRTATEPAIGLGELVMSDGPVGPHGPYWDERNTTLLTPSPTALAATWSPTLVEQVGRLLGAECRRMGVHVLLAPTINLHRSPYGGRHFECFSEDPLLTAELAVGYLRGVQSQRVAATVKHYVANDSETERFTVDVRVDERTLREVYLAPFEAAVRAGVWALMSAYNGVNGTSMTESPLLDDPLKTEWGFDGLVVSDWTAVRSVAAATVGQDLAMPGPNEIWSQPLIAAIQAGEVDPRLIEDKLRRLLRLADRVGQLGPVGSSQELSGTVPSAPDPSSTAVQSGREFLAEVSATSMVLLHNASAAAGSAVLPLDAPTVRSLALIGPNALAPRLQGGGSAGCYPERISTPADGLRAALGPETVLRQAAGCYLDDRPTPLTAEDVTDPVTGEPGLRVRYLGPADVELRSERRLSGKLLWLGDDRLAEVEAIEVLAELLIDEDGEWTLALGGNGRYRLDLDDTTVIDQAFRLESDDPAAGLAAPPHARHTVAARAGTTVRLRARYQLRHPQDILDAEMIWLALGKPRRDAAAELAHAVQLAADSEVAVVIVGTTEQIESEGFDRSTLALPGEQDRLVRAVAAVNPRTIVVVNSGAPVWLPWAHEVAAVLVSWFPGQEFGVALGNVLTGRAEPAGRLPTSWPAPEDAFSPPDVRPRQGILRYTEGLQLGYRGWATSGVVPRYPFGFGLGYTSWQLANARLAPRATTEPATGDVELLVTVRNTGLRAGRQVVQAYLSRPDSRLERPERWLAGFASVTVAAQDSRQVELRIARRAFQHWDVETGGWQCELGEFTILVGQSSVDLDQRLTVQVG